MISKRSLSGRSTVIRWYPKSRVPKIFTFAWSGCASSAATATAFTYSSVMCLIWSLLTCFRLSPSDLRIFSNWSRASSRMTLPRSAGAFRLDRIQKYVEMPVL